MSRAISQHRVAGDEGAERCADGTTTCQLLSACWHISAIDYLESLRGPYGLWQHPTHPQLSGWLTFDLEISLRRRADGDWTGNEEPATFTPYRRGARRY